MSTADPANSPDPAPSLRRRLEAFRQRHARAEHLLFFVGGFSFDALMVRRIDDAPILIQQGAYLAVAGLLLFGLNAWDHRQVEPPRSLRWLWRWSQPVLHFVLGTLLNAYVLFYFKSASGLSALLFLGAITLLLLVNELPQFRRFGPVVLFGLYSFCLTSYFAYLYPVLFGRLRPWMFPLAVATSLLPLVLLAWGHHWLTRDGRRVLREALLPSFGVQAVLVLLFVGHLVPPVPLSLRDIGIYHGVSKTGLTYELSHHPVPWWRFSGPRTSRTSWPAPATASTASSTSSRPAELPRPGPAALGIPRLRRRLGLERRRPHPGVRWAGRGVCRLLLQTELASRGLAGDGGDGRRAGNRPAPLQRAR